MPARRAVDPVQARAAVLAVADWLRDDALPPPGRDELASAVRLTARVTAAYAPGASVELRVPPFVAVQCISGLQHRRGTPPNVVEADARTWLLLATGLLSVPDAAASGDCVCPARAPGRSPTCCRCCALAVSPDCGSEISLTRRVFAAGVAESGRHPLPIP